MMIAMLGVKMRAFALVPVIIGALAALVQGAAAQSRALPPDVALAIEEAIRVSDLAAANAAFSANIANHGQPTGIADRTRLFIAQSSLAEAVVEGIARHPGAAAAIVSAAVSRAPGHGRAIAHRASIAFPRFAELIAAAAGLPPPRQTPPALTYMTPPPIYAASAPPPFYAQPAIRTAQAVRPAAVAAPPARDLAESSRLWPDFGISELRFGVVHHDTGVFGRTEEGGVDITLGVRFLPLRGDIWEFLRNPRPFIGANINTEGNTHALDISDFHHLRINHSKLFADRDNHINGIENFWNQAKRHLRKFNGVPKHHFHLFLKECEWRFNEGSPKQRLRQLKKWVKLANKR